MASNYIDATDISFAHLSWAIADADENRRYRAWRSQGLVSSLQKSDLLLPNVFYISAHTALFWYVDRRNIVCVFYAFHIRRFQSSFTDFARCDCYDIGWCNVVVICIEY